MKRQWSLVALVALAVGCDSVLGIEAGIPAPDAPEGPPAPAPPECVVDADCKVEEPACQSAASCTNGVCLFNDVPDGIAIPEQTVGDCSEEVCNGEGKTRFKDVPTDALDDGNACTADTCNGSTPVHTNICSCGDGKTTEALGEECDDGNTSSDDACSATCEEQRVLQVSQGVNTTCAVLSGGRVKCWGYNNYGHLGLGDKEHRGDNLDEMGANLPAVDLGPGQRAKAVTAGQFYECALLETGDVKCWGYSVGTGTCLSQMHGDEPNEMGTSLPPVNLGTGLKATAIDARFYTTCALLEGGAIKCWGYNDSGQLGLGDTQSRGAAGKCGMGDELPTIDLGTGYTATAIALGSRHACAIVSGKNGTVGQVKCWGDNSGGQVGLADTTKKLGDEPGEMGDALPYVCLGPQESAIAIAAGTYHTCVLLAPGRVKCWGKNDMGQLGLGHKNPVVQTCDAPYVNLGTNALATAITVGANQTCALLQGGKVKCWGINTMGSVGAGNPDVIYGDEPTDMGDALPYVNLGTGAVPFALSRAAGDTCALLTDGSIKCWGANINGSLGQGHTNPIGDQDDEMGNNLPTTTLFTDKW